MRNSYILLRNNIESSSLQFDELQEIGLQETDLIWVECQSVCWQHPNEVAELKSLLAMDNNEKQHEPILNTQKDLPNKKLVYVELPDKEEILKETKSFAPISEAALVDMTKYGNPENADNILASKKAIIATPKYDQSFEELNITQHSNAGSHKKLESTIFGFELPENIKKIAVYTALIATGAILMLLIMNNDNKNKIAISQVAQQQEEATPAAIIAAPEIIEEFEAPAQEILEEPPQQSIANNKIYQIENQVTPETNKAKSNTTKKTTIANEPKAITEKNEKSTGPITESKTSVKNVSPESIKSKVTLSTNDYNMGSFGGIKNLEITLANGSSYLLDKVTVEINYLNPEGNTVNFDKIFFKSINPGDIAIVPVKKSKRGVKIEYKIIKIEWLNNNSGNAESHTYSRN